MQTWIVPIVRVRQRTNQLEIQADSQEQAKALAELLDESEYEKIDWGSDSNDDEDNIDYYVDEPFKK